MLKFLHFIYIAAAKISKYHMKYLFIQAKLKSLLNKDEENKKGQPFRSICTCMLSILHKTEVAILTDKE